MNTVNIILGGALVALCWASAALPRVAYFLFNIKQDVAFTEVLSRRLLAIGRRFLLAPLLDRQKFSTEEEKKRFEGKKDGIQPIIYP